MLVKLNFVSLRHPVLLVLAIVSAQANSLVSADGQYLYSGNNEDSGTGSSVGRESVSDCEPKHLSYSDINRPVELDEHGDDGSELLVLARGKGKDRRRRSNSALSPRWLMQCPKEAASVRSDVSGFAQMIFHRPGSSMGYRISENSGGVWSEMDVDLMITEGGFDLTKPTVLYTHGWSQNSMRSWLTAVRKLYDKMEASGSFKPGFNLLMFDWSGHDSVIYGKAVSHVPELGLLLAQFFEQLRDRHNYNTTSVHLVSFSLSGHIVGTAARQLAKVDQISQITALDPTGVCFHEKGSSQFNLQYGLRASDARIVVAKHYNMGTFGSKDFIGGLDIIVNNGKSQPSMNSRRSVGSLASPDVASHMRASWHESAPFDLDSDCHEMAYACSSYDAFIHGECGDCGPKNDSCYPFSTFGNIQLETQTSVYKPGTTMYIMTGSDKFCAYLYQVVAQLTPDAQSSAFVKFSKGKFKFALDGIDVRVAPKHQVASSARFTQLLKVGSKIESFEDRIELDSTSAGLSSSVEYIEIKFLSHVSPTVRRASSIKYCPDKKTGKKLINCKKNNKKRSSGQGSSKKKSKTS